MHRPQAALKVYYFYDCSLLFDLLLPINYTKRLRLRSSEISKMKTKIMGSSSITRKDK